jgi:farnesyl diphosphate synthase
VNIETDFTKYQERVNRLLTNYLSDPPPLSQSLHDAMCYAVLNGGKRLRPLFIYTLGTALGVALEELDHAACAIEFIHAYSLIHDDMPSMDNDDWRRGKPSCHKQFGEAMALLAGDSLQTLAFDVLLKAPLKSDKIVKMLNVLAKAAGPWGMIAGQAMDFSHSGFSDKSSAEMVHALKTGALFSASLEFSGIAADLPSDSLLLLAHIGSKIGLAYQIQDDVSDNESINFWQNPTERKNYLEKLSNQILMDLRSVLVLSLPQAQDFTQLLKTFFIDKPIENIYQ